MRALALLVTALSLPACQAAAPEDPTDLAADGGDGVEVEVGDHFILAPGGSAGLPGMRLTFGRVEDDSRCPTDVTCVWQGDAVVVVETVAGGETLTWRLHAAGEPRGPRVLEVGGRTIELVGLEPAPRSETTILPADYRATFRLLR